MTMIEDDGTLDAKEVNAGFVLELVNMYYEKHFRRSTALNVLQLIVNGLLVGWMLLGYNHDR